MTFGKQFNKFQNKKDDREARPDPIVQEEKTGLSRLKFWGNKDKVDMENLEEEEKERNSAPIFDLFKISGNPNFGFKDDKEKKPRSMFDLFQRGAGK